MAFFLGSSRAYRWMIPTHMVKSEYLLRACFSHTLSYVQIIQRDQSQYPTLRTNVLGGLSYIVIPHIKL